MDQQQILALIIFGITIIAIILDVFDTTVLALLGAAAMIFFKVIPIDNVMGYVSFNTLEVLVGMMLIVAVLKETGIFEFMATFTAKACKGNTFKILICLGIITAIFSAILDNVTTVLLMGPVTFYVTKKLKVNPIPFIMIEIFSSNIGGTATLIGDPPNIMIGSASGLDFLSYIQNQLPIVVIILIVTMLLIYLNYKKKLNVKEEDVQEIMKLNPKEFITDKPLLIKGLIILIIVILGFIFEKQLGIESGIIAIIGACILLIVSKKKMSKVINDVEWTTILFFFGLFILVGGLEETGIIKMLANFVLTYGHGNIILIMLMLLWISAIVSAFLDNIPFVATIIPLIITLGDSGINTIPLWWAVSLGACLGGNGSIIGASANVILSKISEKNGYKISFLQYLKIGFPLMIISIVLSTAYLMVKY